MARDLYTGVPDVTPELAAPNDYQHVEATPASFGAAVTEGGEALGAGLLKSAEFYGQVAANEATNNYLDQSTKLLYGDPGKMVTGPDGSQTPDTGFFGLRGAAAMRARPEVAQQLDEIIREQQEGLQTPMARQQFETESRRYRAQMMERIGAHADAEQKTWAASTNQTTADLAINQITRSPLDDGIVGEQSEQVRSAYVKNAMLKGESAGSAILKADQDVALARIRSLIGSDDPAQRAAAQKVLDDSAGVLGSLPNYDGIVRSVKQAGFSAIAAPSADQFFNDTMANLAGGGAQAAGALGPAPKGGVYDQIGVVAAQHAATPAETDFLTRTALIESHGNPNAVSPSGTYHGVFQYPATGPQGVENQTVATLQRARQNEATLHQAGVANVTGADLYIMHQQGPAGGKALLTAAPDANAIAALTPAYHGDQSLAMQAIAGNIGMPYRTVEQQAAANAAAKTMTVGQFVGFWNRKWGGGGGAAQTGAPGQYPSTADALRANMPQILDRARAQAEKLFPNYPDQQEQWVNGIQRRFEQTISQQDQMYTVDTHVVQAAIEAGKPISEQQLRETSPQVAAAWDRLQMENPYAAAGAQRMFDANAKGAALVYGGQFKDYLDRALAPSTDPNRITNPTQLYTYVGSGENAPLTNTGVGQISKMLALRSGPQGEAQAAQIKGFVDRMHGQLTFSNRLTGVYDQKGEAAYAKFIGQALPILERAAQSGSLADVLNPNSPNYVGKVAVPFMRTDSERLDDQLKHSTSVTPPATRYTPATLRSDLASLDNDQQRSDFLHAAARDGRLRPDVYAAYLAGQTAPTAAPPPLQPPPPAEYVPGRGYVTPGQ